VITIQGDYAVTEFKAFDLNEYSRFLDLKRLPAPELNLSYDWRNDTYTVKFPARYAEQLGIKVKQDTQLLPMPQSLWDYQRYFTAWALKRKRAAFFWDCGLGKTRAFLEFAFQAMYLTKRKALIMSIAGNLVNQTIRECERFYRSDLPILRIDTREQLIAWLQKPGAELAITNYEKFIPGQIPELRNLGALILDESSILKTGGGKIKWNLIHSAKGIEYKLSNTATPAPNEVMEYASQASFLETIRTEGDVIWTYFKKNDDGTWRLIKHAEKAFYTFLASWSVFMRSPAAYGFKDNVRLVPQPEYFIHNVPATAAQLDEAQRYRFQIGAGLIGNERMGVKERLKLSQIAKGFIYEKQLGENDRAVRGELNAATEVAGNDRSEANEGRESRHRIHNNKRDNTCGTACSVQEGGKRSYRGGGLTDVRRITSAKPRFIAELISQEVAAGRQVLVWTVFDEEGEILSKAIPEIAHELLSGKTKPRDRERIIDNFQSGKLPVLISKAELLGYGMNLQQGSAMIFSGWNDSFEQWYQAIRRMVRYGQTKRVRVHVPMIEGLEDAQLENVQAKAQAYEEQAALQEQAYREALEGMIA